MARFDVADRLRLAKKGQAIPNADGPPKFPITDRKSLHAAIMLHGKVPPSERAKVKAHIKRQAKRLGMMSVIPDSWSVG